MSDNPSRPSICRVHAFFDAQNLFLSAKECFGYIYPNYDPAKLAQKITELEENRKLIKVHFYTGVHEVKRNEFLHHFWMNKLQGLRRAGVNVYYRYLKYADYKKETSSSDFEIITKPREKGVDVKLAIDLIKLARKGMYDIAIIFSQDTDLNEAVNEIYIVRDRLNIVSEVWADPKLSEILKDHFTKLDRYLKENDRSENTINHYFSLLKTLYFYTIKKGYYKGENPIKEIKPYVIEEKRREYSPEELAESRISFFIISDIQPQLSWFQKPWEKVLAWLM